MLSELFSAFKAAQALPFQAQRQLAELMLQWITEQRAEGEWDALISSPASQQTLERLGAEAHEQIAAGKTFPLDERLFQLAFIEECVPWNPIPEQFNGNWAVDVQHVEQGLSASSGRDAAVSVALAAYAVPVGEAQSEVGAWRLDFYGCWAYHHRIVGYHGAAPLTRPNSNAAFWEIAPSRFTVESGVLDAYGTPGRRFLGNGELSEPINHTFHHYVIMSAIHDVYEFVAERYTCEPLPERYARTFDGPFPGW